MNNDKEFIGRPGHDALWLWFGLDRASFLTLPRVLMHEMPDDWQAKMAALLDEYDEKFTFDGMEELVTPCVMLRGPRNRFMKMPSWLINYRHPQKADIERYAAAIGKGGENGN